MVNTPQGIVTLMSENLSRMTIRLEGSTELCARGLLRTILGHIVVSEALNAEVSDLESASIWREAMEGVNVDERDDKPTGAGQPALVNPSAARGL